MPESDDPETLPGDDGEDRPFFDRVADAFTLMAQAAWIAAAAYRDHVATDASKSAELIEKMVAGLSELTRAKRAGVVDMDAVARAAAEEK